MLIIKNVNNRLISCAVETCSVGHVTDKTCRLRILGSDFCFTVLHVPPQFATLSALKLITSLELFTPQNDLQF